jgi:hypothetical protein
MGDRAPGYRSFQPSLASHAASVGRQDPKAPRSDVATTMTADAPT